MALYAGSPAINVGGKALAVDARGNSLTTDQRGPDYVRTSNGTVDMGAFEYQPIPLVATATVDENDGGTLINPRGPGGQLSLREAIEFSDDVFACR
jgi:hypothetical protein